MFGEHDVGTGEESFRRWGWKSAFKPIRRSDSLSMLLQMAGHEITVVYDGQQALETIETSRPEVALLDIGMPALDGYEVARRVRLDTRVRNMMLIAVTGWGQENDKARAETAGFDLHFTKPVEPTKLMELLGGELPAR